MFSGALGTFCVFFWKLLKTEAAKIMLLLCHTCMSIWIYDLCLFVKGLF